MTSCWDARAARPAPTRAEPTSTAPASAASSVTTGADRSAESAARTRSPTVDRAASPIPDSTGPAGPDTATTGSSVCSAAPTTTAVAAVSATSSSRGRSPETLASPSTAAAVSASLAWAHAECASPVRRGRIVVAGTTVSDVMGTFPCSGTNEDNCPLAKRCSPRRVGRHGVRTPHRARAGTPVTEVGRERTAHRGPWPSRYAGHR